VLLLADIEIHRLPSSFLLLSKETSQAADFLGLYVFKGLQAVELGIDSFQGVQGQVSLSEAALIVDH
jgi:hypothetical protein